jgi:hypothetical protein
MRWFLERNFLQFVSLATGNQPDTTFQSLILLSTSLTDWVTPEYDDWKCQ